MNQLKIGILLNYVTIILSTIIGVVYTPFLVRSLGMQDYGMYALAFAIAGYLSLLDLGIGNSIVRYISKNKVTGTNEIESKMIGFFFKFFLFIACITLMIGFILTANLEVFLSKEFDNEQVLTLKWMLLILTINFALGFIFNTFSAVLQAYEQFILLKISNILRLALTPIISVYFLLYNPNLVILIIILASVNSSSLILNYLYYKKKLKLKISFKNIEKSYKKEILGYSFIIFIVAIADRLYWQTDQVLLGILRDSETVAIYAIAIQVIIIFMSLSTAINGVFLPKITKLVSTENYLEQLNRLFLKVSKIQTWIIGLAFSGFIIIGKEFIYLWIGSEFIDAYIIIIILLSTFSIDLIQNLGIVIMQAKGKYKFRAYTLIICSILNVIISIPIIKVYGGFGAAIITAIFVFLGNIVILNIYYHKILHLDMIVYWKRTVKILTGVGIITVIGFGIKGFLVIEGWLSIILFIILYSIVYVLIIFIVYFSKAEKLDVLDRLFKKK